MMSKLLPVSEFHKLRYLELEEQIRLRRDLENQLVGTLYPSILQTEIQQLQQALCRVRNAPVPVGTAVTTTEITDTPEDAKTDSTPEPT